MSDREKDIREKLSVLTRGCTKGFLVFGLVDEEPNILPDGFRAVPAEPGNGLAALLDEMDRMSAMIMTDPLTGLRNRRGFDRDLRASLSKNARRKTGFSLVMIDIDHFKKVNDLHGHDAGDKVLEELARRMEACVRPEDGAYRLGGEEMAVLIEGDEEAGRRVGGRILDEVRETPFDTGAVAEQVDITVSAGCLHVPGPADPASVYKQADDLLYKAKHAGRNRIMWGQHAGGGLTKEERRSLYTGKC